MNAKAESARDDTWGKQGGLQHSLAADGRIAWVAASGYEPSSQLTILLTTHLANHFAIISPRSPWHSRSCPLYHHPLLAALHLLLFLTSHPHLSHFAFLYRLPPWHPKFLCL